MSATMSAIDGVDALRTRLLDAGYAPVPVRTGQKVPAAAEWQNRARRRELPRRVMTWASNTGILCDGLQAIDIDVDDPALAARCTEVVIAMFGPAPLRFRADSPRRLLVYRAAEGEPTKRTMKGRPGCNVEVLGKGQQFVAFGRHPDGAEYEWDGDDLSQVPLEDLTRIDGEQIDGLFSRLAPILGVEQEPERSADVSQTAPAMAPVLVPAGDVVSDERVRAYAEAALGRELEAVRTAPRGQRNHQLNTSAFAIGQMVGAGWLGEGRVVALLEQASFALAQDDGIISVRKTIASGLRAGQRQPRQMPESDYRSEGLTAEDYAIAAQLQVGGETIDPATGEVLGEEVSAEAGRPRPTEPTLNLVPASSFKGLPIPPREWHVKDLVPSHTVTILGGDGGAGKSLLALQLAVATVAQTGWIGRQVRQGKVLFLTAEDELEELHRRLADVCEAEGVDFGELDSLHLVSLAGKDAVLAAPSGRDGLLRETSLYRAVRAALDAHRPELMVLDTLADLFGGDEINRAHARQFIALLRALAIRFSTTIVLLQHPSQSGMMSGNGSSGSTAWNNSVRSRLYLTRPDGEPSSDRRILKMMKANYAGLGEEVTLRWQKGVFRQEAMGAPDGETRTERACRIFLSLLAEFERAGRHVSPNPSNNFGPTVFAKNPEAAGLNKNDLTRAMELLFSKGVIVVEEHGPQSKRTKKIVIATADRSAEAA